MLLHTLVVGFDVNCYIVGSEQQNEAVVIDPGAESRRIFDVIEERQYAVRAILLTHGHFDHTGAAAELSELTGAKIFAHREEIELIEDPALNLSGMFGAARGFGAPIEPLSDGQIVEVGEMRLKVIHTPGHTPGGISLVAGEGVFCGDLVFAGSVGRTDLPGGSWEVMASTLRNKILSLPDRLALYPGHGRATSVGAERSHNPYLVSLEAG